MFWLVGACFLGGFLGSILARFINLPLKKIENASKMGSMAVPGRRHVQKRIPRANTDLMAYQKEITEEGENRG